MERQRLDNDPSLLEERRKKDELLRKLQEMDKIGNNTAKPIADPYSNTSSASRRQKDDASGYDTPSKRSEPKEYSFTKPVNNLHQGKPSHEDNTTPFMNRQRGRGMIVSKNDDDVGGYQPSFGPTRGGGPKTNNVKPLSLFDDDDDAAPSFNTKTKTEKKSTNLLENLFGPQAESTANKSSQHNKKENETFFITGSKKSPPASQRNTSTTSAFPWDVSSSTATNKNTTNSQSIFGNSDRGGSSTLFGGGAALVEDNAISNSSRPLPRRSRQTNVNTFSAKPSITAVDAFDDEIEEVVL